MEKFTSSFMAEISVVIASLASDCDAEKHTLFGMGKKYYLGLQVSRPTVLYTPFLINTAWLSSKIVTRS